MNDFQVQLIQKWIRSHADEMIKDIDELVRIPSIAQLQENETAPYGKACRDVLLKMEEIGSKYGFSAINDDENCCILVKDSKQTFYCPEVGIWGHLDVVPETGDWHYPPFMVTQKDGYLIGRGVQDDKSACIVILYTLRCLYECGITLPFKAGVCYGTSEEIGMFDLKKWRTKFSVPSVNLIADCGFPVCHGEMGNLSVKWTYVKQIEDKDMDIWAGKALNIIPDYASCKLTRDSNLFESHGIAAHLIASDRGKNAITLLAKTMISITSSDSHQGKLFSFLYDMTSNTPERTIGTVTLIRSDDRQVTMEADYRYSIFTDDNERNIQDGTKAIEYLQSKSRQYGLKMEVMENTHPVFIPDDSPLVTQLMREYKKITGSETKSYTMSGGTYAKLLPNAVAYGPSIEGKTIFHEQGCPPDTGDFHQPDESVSIEELLKAMEIYCRTLPEISIK